ncbi:MAG: hypothetical protein B6243_05260 [Anaerolineaceae bacterium 4572_5.2]|nr:MAG: hypothetical protein B6243_05260 [Anaerolineaceae bacterium 4572_5.2]
MNTKISPKYKQWLIITLLLLFLMAAESAAMHRYALVAPGTADFFARWYGGKELVLHERNPYDREIELEAQQAMFGRHTRPDEDQVNFAYPLYTIYLFLPLTLVPYSWAQAIWMVVLQFSLMGGTLILFDLAKWRPRLWLFIVTLFWSIFFYPGARAIMLGQFSILVFLFLTIAVWGLMNGHDRLAGAILPLATIKPQMVFLVIPLLLLWAWRQKRWQFIVAFGASTAVLLLTSLLWVPDWIFRFLGNLSAYSGYVGFGSPLENMTARLLPALDQWLNPLIAALLAGLLLWQWWLALTRKPKDFLWAIIWTLLIGNLIAFRSATANHVTLYLTIFIIFKRLAPVWQGKAVAALQLAGTVFLWVLFLTTIDKSRGSNFEAIFMHGLLPTVLIIAYLLDWQKLKAITPSTNIDRAFHM